MSDLLSKLGPAQAKVNAKKDELSRNRTILEQKQDVVKQTEAELEVVSKSLEPSTIYCLH